MSDGGRGWRVGGSSRATTDGATTPATAGKTTLVQQAARSPGLFEEGTPEWTDIDPQEMHDVAAKGVAGTGTRLPYLDQIQRSFGRFDVTNVRAHVGGEAGAASTRMGAAGYATGNDVALRDASNLHTVAHEAAHVVQQRGGLQLAGGLGKMGDEHERNADAVADRVVAGASAEELLAPYAGGHGSTSVQHKTVQLYQEIDNPKLPWDRMSDDGSIAVSDHERDAWAQPDKIVASNKILDANKSKAKIKAESGLTKVKVAGQDRYLQQFKMVDRASGDEAELVDDCGGANQQMLGGEYLADRRFAAETNSYGDVKEYTGPSTYYRDDNEAGGNVSTTEQMAGEIYVRIMKNEFKKTLNRVDALREWEALDPAKKNELSKKYGINKYAAPKTGQGVTIGSERDAPGAKGTGYNFHFALNLMSAGQDYLSLEDFHESGERYYFRMYGPASKGQSFAEHPDNATAVDSKSTAMVVVHPHVLDGRVKAEANLRGPRGDTLATLAKGTTVKILLKGKTDIQVKVLTGPAVGKEGWISATLYEVD